MIDLHVHSYVSDGSNSPSELVRIAYEKKIKAISLTDHDSVEGIIEAEQEAQKYSVNFLKGIEISTAYRDGRLLHILGIGIDPSNEEFLKVYNNMKLAREDGLERVIGILKKQGITISMEELRTYAVGKYVDRQAIPKYFVDKKISRTVPEVWYKYLDPIPYGKGELLEADEALDIIRKSGGLSFLAHYHKKIGLDGYNKPEVEEHIKYLIGLGLHGIERYYPTFSNDNIEFIEFLMEKYKLIPSGGTDFHGSNRPEVEMGKCDDGFYVPDSVYENIISKL